MEEYIENNMQVIEIEDYIKAEDYFILSSGINLEDVTFNILWNSEKQCINKGFLFVFRVQNKLYNILLDDGITSINERIIIDGITEERFLRINYLKSDYSYSLLKHDANGSTFHTRYYQKNPSMLFGLELTAKEVYEDIVQIMNSLEQVENIENIISVEKINEVVLTDLRKHFELNL